MVQNAKCYRITRQENPEFLGEFNGGAKTTSNSGAISFENREIWERYARYVSSLTNKSNKQNEWMKYQVIGDQSKEEKIWNLHYIGTSLGKKERKKGKNRASFLSIWVVSSKSKSKKNESKTDQINEEKLDIYRSNTKGKGRKELERDTGKKRRNLKNWGISSKSKWNSTNFLPRW